MKINKQKVLLVCHLSVVACCYLLLATARDFTDVSDALFCLFPESESFTHNLINNPLAFRSFLHLKIRANQLVSTSGASVQCDMDYCMWNGHFSRASRAQRCSLGCVPYLTLVRCVQQRGLSWGQGTASTRCVSARGWLRLIAGWTVRVHHQPSSCCCCLAGNCSVMGAETPARQMERQDLTKRKSSCWHLPSPFFLLF